MFLAQKFFHTEKFCFTQIFFYSKAFVCMCVCVCVFVHLDVLKIFYGGGVRTGFIIILQIFYCDWTEGGKNRFIIGQGGTNSLTHRQGGTNRGVRTVFYCR